MSLFSDHIEQQFFNVKDIDYECRSKSIVEVKYGIKHSFDYFKVQYIFYDHSAITVRYDSFTPVSFINDGLVDDIEILCQVDNYQAREKEKVEKID